MVAIVQITARNRKVWQKKLEIPDVAIGKRHISLRSALVGFVLIGLIASALGIITFVKEQRDTYQATALERAVNVRLNGIELGLGRDLNSNWEQLNALAANVQTMSTEMRRVAFDTLVGDGKRVAWIGFTSAEGVVLSASGGLLEGKTVAEQRWFQKAFQQNYAGDVHDAVLLSKILNKTGRTPMRFIDLSRPIIDAAGNTIGVLGMHIQFDWIKSYLTETATELGMNVYLINEKGGVVLATDGVKYASLDLASIRMATAGLGGSHLETWPDQRSYFTSVLPRVKYENLPAFGWRIVGRIDPDEFTFAEKNLINVAFKLIATLAVILLVITTAFCRAFILPLEQLALSAIRNASGANEYPFVAHQTVELSRLSNALLVLQGKVDSGHLAD